MDSTIIDPASLYPRLLSDRAHPMYSHDLGRHMVRREAGPSAAEALPVTIHMLEDISVQFVQDTHGGMEFVLERDRLGQDEWTDMGLIQQAFRNLKDGLGEDLHVSTLENGLLRIVSGGKYEASFLLLGNLWMQLEEDYGAQMYAAVPSHNVLLIGKQDHRSAILELQQTIRGIFFEANPETLLSKAVYQRFDGEWKIIATAF